MLRFPRKNDVQFVYTIICFLGIWFVICIYLLVSNTIPYKKMVAYFNSNTTGVTSGAGTA
jgi:hypothetical protein